MAEDPPAPESVDLASYLIDPEAELRRVADTHWFAEGINLRGERQPIVLSHDSVRDVLRDRRLSPRSFADDMVRSGLSQETAEQLTPLFRRDGDDHQFHRSLLSAAFTPRSVERLRPIAAATAARLAGGLAVPRPIDFVASFATPLPPEVFAVLFGLPVGDRDRLAHWAAVIGRAFAPVIEPEDLPAIEASAAELRGYARDITAARRGDPGEDLVSRLLAVEVDGKGLDEPEVTALITAFIFAGSETTRRQLTAMIVAFAAQPDSWRLLRDAPESIPGAVEEVLRHAGIIPGLTRVAIEPFEHDGLELDEGEQLALSFQSANHDASTFDDPDRFDIRRQNADDHLTFGWGPHFCVGAGLARVELQESLRVLTQRFEPPVISDFPALPPLGLLAPDVLEVSFEVWPSA